MPTTDPFTVKKGQQFPYGGKTWQVVQRRKHWWTCHEVGNKKNRGWFGDSYIRGAMKDAMTKPPETAVSPGTVFTCYGRTYKTVRRTGMVWICERIDGPKMGRYRAKGRFHEKNILHALGQAQAQGSPPPEPKNTCAPTPKIGFRDLERLNDDLAIIRRRFERTGEMFTASELDLIRMAISYTHYRYEQLASRMRGEAELAATNKPPLL